MSRIIRSCKWIWLPWVCAAACAATPSVAADAAGQLAPPLPTAAIPQTTSTQDIPPAAMLLGGMFGLRTFLGRHGVSLALSETSEVLANASGGVTRAAAYDGVTLATLRVNSQAAVGIEGGTFQASGLQTHGRNLSADTLSTLQTASGIEAARATRLWELWYDQKFWNGRADVKLGQQSLDTEFMVSTTAAVFFNTVFGWPLNPSADLPGGGPAYPLAALGVRLQARPTPDLTLLGGIFDGSPVRQNCLGDAQLCNPSGTAFPTDGGRLIIGEAQYAPGNGGGLAPGKTPLPGAYKIGFWVNTGSVADQRFDSAGLPLAADGPAGVPRAHRDDFGVYLMVDQTLWQAQDGGAGSVGGFVRAVGSPPDRNLIGVSVNAGVVWRAPIAGRDNDSAGIAVGYGRIGQAARARDRDSQRLTGAGFARSDETFVEATYQYSLCAGWQIAPDAQYVFNPGAGIANPAEPTRKLRNEAVFGLRTTLTF